MPPRYVEDVFSAGMGTSREDVGHGNNGLFSSAFTPPNGKKPSKSMTKSNRVMVEKAVDTAELRHAKRTKAEVLVETPQVIDRTMTSHGLSRTSIASSQASYWEGDDEFEKLVNFDDEQSVEDMPDTQPDSSESIMDSTESSTSIDTVSTAQTSVESGSVSTSGDCARRRKRTESLDMDCHLSAGNPAQMMRIYESEIRRETNQTASVTSKVLSHTHATKNVRPLPRLINPGPATASTEMSTVIGHGQLGPAVIKVNDIASMVSPVTVIPSSASDIFIIAHDQHVQSLMDKYRIAKGVQLEIARGITQNTWRWTDVTEKRIQQLVGSHKENIGKVAGVLGKSDPGGTATNAKTWAELDREHTAWMEGCGRGLGLMGPWLGENNWFGGRVQLQATISLRSGRNDERPDSYTISLKRFSMGKSFRLARFATSLSVLQLKFANGASRALKDGGVGLLARKLVLCGRVYCPFYAKDGKAYFVETNENYGRGPVPELGDDRRRSFDTYVCWHNSLDLNAKQPVSKWATRFALALSTSRPGVIFQPENIYRIKDEFAEGVPKCTETTMTDGCGLINKSALVKVAQMLGQSTFRIAIQGRIAGAKGLWLLHPDPVHHDLGAPARIWIRESQIKVDLPSDWDRSQLVFDVVRANRLSAPASVNYQTIMNMSHNGVKDGCWERLMAAALNKHICPLTTWEGPFALPNLAKAVENAGGLMGTRLVRAAGSDARLYGYAKDEREESDSDADNTDGNALVTRDPRSGYPASLYELTRELLQAGFSPLETPLLRDKLYYILTTVVNSCLERFHIPVEMSAEAFIAPDPTGELKEDEIFFHCSKDITNPEISSDSCIVQGDVLLFRNPTRVASDIRKVRAVSNDKLTALGYTDVILLSTKGSRSLASYLAGGDYDGDTATVVVEPEIVNEFKNHELVNPPSDLFEKNFEREIEKVSEFLVTCPSHLLEHEIFGRLLLGLSDTKVGQYSNFHENAVYKIGYNAPETVRLAYMFTTCLDGSKTGYRAVKSVFRVDEKSWNMNPPPCMQKGERDPLADTSNRNTVTRSRKLGPFILDKLKTKGDQLKQEAFKEYDRKCAALNQVQWRDEALFRPWQEFDEHANMLAEKYRVSVCLEDRKRIMDFVERLCEEYIKKLGNHFGSSPKKAIRSSSRASGERNSDPSTIRQEFSARFHEGLSAQFNLFPSHARKDVVASYAVHYASRCSGKLGPEFPFVVALDSLCAMKAKASGGSIACTREFSGYSLLNGNLLRSTTQSCNLFEAPMNTSGTT